MKKLYIITAVTAFLLLINSSKTFSQQNDCGNNAGFETGTTAGWICKSGEYASANACPPDTLGCPAFPIIYTGFTCLNAGGINAPINSANDRHTIVTGAGMDPNSLNTVPVVPPGGGTYAFRLGNGIAGVGPVYGGALAEAIRLTFMVTPQNAGFTYRYAVFLQEPGHPTIAQPRFEILVLDEKDSVIPCGYYKVVAGTCSNCPGTGAFKSNGNWRYKDWTAVGLDLTGYIGRNISVEFRTSDCMGGGTTSTSCSNGTCTTNLNGSVCTSLPGACCIPPGCIYQPGSHSAYAYIDAYCSPLDIKSQRFCAGTSSITICGPVGYKSYSWPQLGGATTQCVTVSNPVPGTVYTVNLVSVTDCPTSTTVTLLGTDATTRDTSICGQGGGNITLNVTPVTPGTYTYSWTGPGGFTSTLQNPVIPLPATTTTYSVKVTDTAGCSVIRPMTINIGLPSPITISPTQQICLGGQTTLTATANNAVTYSWSPPTGLSGTTGTSVTANPLVNSTYTVTVTNNVGCTSTDTVLVKVNTISVAVNPPVEICLGKSIVITATGGASYTWTPAAGLNDSTIYNPTASPTATTNYLITIKDANGCIGSGTVLVTVNPTPPVTTTNGTMCSGKSTQIGVVESGYTYTWSAGTTPSNTQITTVSPATNATYTVTVSDAKGCTNTGTADVIVNPLPTVTTSADQFVCIGQTATISANGGVSYTWTPVGVNPPTGQTGTVTPPDTGKYTFTVTVTDNNGCVNTGTANVIANPLPTVSISPPTTVCIGTPVQLTTSGGKDYSWNPVTGLNPTTGPNVTATPPGTTTYTVTVTDVNGCVSTAQTTVTINTYIKVDISPPEAICIGACTNIISTAPGATNFIWTPGGFTTSSINVCPTITTTYSVHASNNSGCNGDTSVTINVNPLPNPVPSPSTAVCLACCTTISVNPSVGSTYSWSPIGITAQSTSVCPKATTIYTVTETDANKCVNTASTMVTVNTISLAMSPSTAFCKGSSTQIVATPTGVPPYAIVWTPTPDLSNPNIANPTASPTQTTTYTVNVVDKNGCTVSGMVTVTVNPLPGVSTSDRSICEGESTQLNAIASNANIYLWSPSAGLSNPNISNPIATPPSTTIYTINVSSPYGCPTATATATVTVHSTPAILAGPDTSIFAGTEISLYVTGGGTSFQWSPSTALSCTTCPNPYAKPMKTITYTVSIVDPFGCSNSDKILIHVEDCLTLYVPNSFTPTRQDSKNDIFFAYGSCIYQFEFYIFDRWGTKVFETHDPAVGWDGTYQGKMAQSDVYVWLVKAKSITGMVINKTGTVTLVQ